MAALAALLMICCFFTVSTVKAGDPSEEAPTFCANIEYSPQGYIVKGTFTEFPSDIIHAEPLYSLDGETWQTCGEEWNITNWSVPWTDMNETELEKFQNQTCFHSASEPLKSYLAGKLDCFYVKLLLTRENGITYETQAAVIDRGGPGPVPEEMSLIAKFAPSIRVRTLRPFSCYGRYQITVSEDAAPEEISTFLPDTLPIEIELQKGIDYVTSGVIDCPVTWKSLPSLKLTAGESVTIPDAAEKIVIPGDTVLNTPLGIFQLNDPLGIDQYELTDEVKLVLNVTAKGSSPTGALACENDGLQMAFHQKPTGATAIRAYTFSNGEAEWTELPELPLLQAVNSQPSAAGSGYTYILDNAQEPYRSYLDARAEGRDPSPFFIGLKIEGGVYDGRTLILTWPDTYTLPPDLPEPGGSGGNADNAGSDNKDDGTAEGQRPVLPESDGSGGKEDSSSTSGAQPPAPPESDGSGGKENSGGTNEAQPPAPPESDSSGGNRDSAGDSTAEGQRPKLPQNTGIKNTASSEGESGHKNTQSQRNTHTAGSSDTSAQASTAAQAAAGTITEAVSSAAGTNVQAKSPTPASRSVQNNKSAARIPSDSEESLRRNSKNSSRKSLLPILAAIAAVLCITGISIAAASGKPDKKDRS